MCVRVVARPLGLVPGAAKHHQPRAPVVLERLGAEDLGKPPFMPASPHLHLPEPVLRHHVSLCEEEVPVVLGEDVGDTPFVPDDVDRLLQARSRQLPVDLCQRPIGEFF
jgi:hypothetical protein